MGFLQKRFFNLTTNKTNLTLHEQHKLLKRLYRLLDNGYSLTNSLDILQWDNKWKKTVHIVSSTLKEGNTLYYALEKAHFHTKIVSFMYFAMAHGDLTAAIKQCCRMLEQQITFMKKFKQASRYPLILFVLFVLLLHFIKNSVYPSFIQLISTTDSTSSLHFISVNSINFLFYGTYITTICFIFLLLVYRFFIYKNIPPEKLIPIYLKLPVVKGYKKLNTTFLFSLHLSSLLLAGISLKECLQTLKVQKQLSILSYYAEYITDELQHGKTLLNILPSCRLFEDELVSIFQKNANTDQLIKDLQVYAEFLMDHLDEKLKKLITLIQPIFFIILATLIVIVYLSLMLPMFQLIKNI